MSEKVLVLMFSGRKNGNCKELFKFIKDNNDAVCDGVNVNNLEIHACSGCQYECMKDECVFRDDDMYELMNKHFDYDQIIYLVPMYCGVPTSSYFVMNERSQDYWMHNSEKYNDYLSRLYVIGIGNEERNLFFSILNQPFLTNGIEDHTLILSSHKYQLNSINDRLTVNQNVKELILDFIK